ncbi:MAG TPA: SNF2-related protein [Rhizobium sp.]|nr:SNF2-related protein [Rhizobium sp.]
MKPLHHYEGIKVERVIRAREDMHGFQRKAKRFLMDNPMSALFIDLGMGKTIICLTLIVDLINRGWKGKALVIAPLRVAKATWPDEIDEWEHLEGLPYTLIRAEDDDDDIREQYEAVYKPRYAKERWYGETPADAAKFARAKANPVRQEAKEAKRIAQTLEDTQLHIINIERIEWLVDFWAKRWKTHREKWPYDTILIDESSKFGVHNTLRFKALKRVLPRVKRLHELTASPASEGYMKLFAMTYLMDQGERLGRNITAYRKRHWDQNPYTKAWKLKRGHDEKIANKIADIVMTLRADDYRDVLKVQKWLPLKRPVKLSSEHMAIYRRFEDTMFLNFDTHEIEALNGGALVNKLLQFTAGAVYDESKKIVAIHNEKIEALRELKEELGDEPLMVCYWFKSSLDRLKKAFPKAVVMDKAGKCIKPWNEGKIEMLLINPGSAAHGLNMQKGPGHDVAFFDLVWSRELYEQVIGRVARQGQRQLVRVHHLLVLGSADELVYDTLRDKGEGQERLFRFIRAMQRRIEKRKDDGQLRPPVPANDWERSERRVA